MKKFYYSIRKKDVYERFTRIKIAQKKRLDAIKKVREQVKEQGVMPLYWQIEWMGGSETNPLATTLHYPKKNRVSYAFMKALCNIDYPRIIWKDEVLAKAIPLSWFINKN